MLRPRQTLLSQALGPTPGRVCVCVFLFRREPIINTSVFLVLIKTVMIHAAVPVRRGWITTDTASGYGGRTPQLRLVRGFHAVFGRFEGRQSFYPFSRRHNTQCARRSFSSGRSPFSTTHTIPEFPLTNMACLTCSIRTPRRRAPATQQYKTTTIRT